MSKSGETDAEKIKAGIKQAEYVKKGKLLTLNHLSHPIANHESRN